MERAHFLNKIYVLHVKALVVSFLTLFVVNTSAQVPDARSYPFNFDALDHLSRNLAENDSIIPVYRHGKFVYTNTYSNKPIFKQEFEEAYPFAGRYGLVRLNGKYGIINKQGEYLVKPSYPGFSLFTSVNYGIMFGDSSFFSFSQGKMLKEPEILCAEPVGPQMWGVKHGNKYALEYRDKGRSEPIYDSVLALSYNFAIVQKSGKIGIVNASGKTTLPFEYDGYMGLSGFEYAFPYALKKGGTWYYFDGYKMLFNSTVRATRLNSTVFIFKKDTLYNYLDDHGVVALHHDYKWISDNGYMAINKKDELVLFNRRKNEFTYFTPK